MTGGDREKQMLGIRQGSPEWIVWEYERIFGGITVEGIDLATSNRMSFFIAIQSRVLFASPKPLARSSYAFQGQALFYRERLRGTSPPEPSPPAGRPRMLFFFEGPNPSVQETLRAVLREFTPNEAVAASPFGKRLDLEGEHDQIALEPFLPERLADSLVGVERAIRVRQKKAEIALFKRASLRAWLLRMAIRTAQAARAFRQFFDAFPASVLVTASDSSFWGRCATLEAIHRGIPTVTLQHGMMASPMAYVPMVSHRTAVWGEGSARFLRERGIPPEKIVVTGAPRLDAIVKRACKSKQEIASMLDVEASRPWVVLATNPIPFDRNAVLLATAREGVRLWNDQAVLLVKLHPSEDPIPYQPTIAGDPRVRLAAHGHVDLHDLVAASDAVITFHSSVGMEAMLLDRPVVSLDSSGESNPLYIEGGAAASAGSAEALARALREDVAPGTNAAARHALRERYVRENMLASDGKSGARVANLVRSLAEGGKE